MRVSIVELRAWALASRNTAVREGWNTEPGGLVASIDAHIETLTGMLQDGASAVDIVPTFVPITPILDRVDAQHDREIAEMKAAIAARTEG